MALELSFNDSEDCSVLPIVVVKQFADSELTPFEKVAAKFPHHRELSFIPMVAGWKKVQRSAVRRQLHALARRTAVEKWYRVDLNSARLEHALNLALRFVEVKQVFERF